MWQTNDHFQEIYRSTLKTMLNMMDTCLSGIERLQDVHAKTVGDMRSSQDAFTKKIDSAQGLPELQAAYVELMLIQHAKMSSYWSSMCAANCQHQAEILNDTLTKVSSTSHEISHDLNIAPAVALPVLTALKMVVGAAHSTYAATARANEEIAHLGAARIREISTPVSQQGNNKTKRAA